MWHNAPAVGVPRRCSWKTPPGPRGSNGIQTVLVGSGSGGTLSGGDEAASKFMLEIRSQCVMLRARL